MAPPSTKPPPGQALHTYTADLSGPIAPATCPHCGKTAPARPTYPDPFLPKTHATDGAHATCPHCQAPCQLWQGKDGTLAPEYPAFSLAA